MTGQLFPDSNRRNTLKVATSRLGFSCSTFRKYLDLHPVFSATVGVVVSTGSSDCKGIRIHRRYTDADVIRINEEMQKTNPPGENAA